VYAALNVRKINLPRIFAEDASRVPSFIDMEISKMMICIGESVANINKNVASQIEQFNQDLNLSIATKFKELRSTIMTQIDDVKQSVTSELSTLNNDVSSRADKIGSTLTSVVDDMKTINTVFNDNMTQIRDENSKFSTRSCAGATGSNTDEGGLPWMTMVKGRAASCMDHALGASRIPPPPPPPVDTRRKIVGARKSDGAKITSSTAGQWHIFIGRLGKDTQESDIKEFLEENNVTVKSIFKLKAAQPWQETSAAFRVSVTLDCKDSIMNADLWPDNVEVRDWVFKQK